MVKRIKKWDSNLAVNREGFQTALNWFPPFRRQSGARWGALEDAKPAMGTCCQDDHLCSMLNRSLWAGWQGSLQAEQKHLRHSAAKLESHRSRKGCCKAPRACSVLMAILHLLPAPRDVLPMCSSQAILTLHKRAQQNLCASVRLSLCGTDLILYPSSLGLGNLM